MATKVLYARVSEGVHITVHHFAETVGMSAAEVVEAILANAFGIPRWNGKAVEEALDQYNTKAA